MVDNFTNINKVNTNKTTTYMYAEGNQSPVLGQAHK